MGTSARAAHRVTAQTRLTVLAVIGLLAALFACRPAWSPDGKRLLFHCPLDGDHQAIACYDRSTGKAEFVFAAPQGAMVEPLWNGDGTRAVFVCGQRDRDAFTIVVQSIPAIAAPLQFEIRTGGNSGASLVVPPVVLGRSLYLASGGIHRVDLDTGQVVAHVAAAKDEEMLLVPAGNGLGYVKRTKQQGDQLEVGRIDPDTLQATPVLRTPAEDRWQLRPVVAFSPDGTRIAVAAEAETAPKSAILVFAGGELESTLPADDDTTFGSIRWSPHGASLYATFCRHGKGQPQAAWGLLETMVGGSVTREVPLVTTNAGNDPAGPSALLFQLALSPDGRTAAMSTAHLEGLAPAQEGLYLVDLAGKQRAVTRVPFPAVLRAIAVGGSDTMLALAQAWADAYGSIHPAQPITITGGGTGIGMKQCIEGSLDLAMATRPAKPAEQTTAQRRLGTALVEHKVAVAALAVAVHRDNPLAALSMEQLQQVFRDQGAKTWAEFGVTMPPGCEPITLVGLQNTHSAYDYFREAVLGAQGRFALDCLNLNTTADIATMLARTKNAIGYLNIASVDDRIKVLPLVGTAGGSAIPPSARALADGSYPLARPLFLYTRGEPRPEVAAFLQWIASEPGKAVTQRAGYLPVQ